MTPMMTRPTPYPQVNRVLERLCIEVRTALGDRFTGLYLYGSLASGDFSPDTSDVDFLAVTAGTLSNTEVAALEAMKEPSLNETRIRELHPEGRLIAWILSTIHVTYSRIRDLIRGWPPAQLGYQTLFNHS